MKRIFLLLFFSLQLVQAQNYTVKGIFIDSIHKIQNVALYQLLNGEKQYKKYVQVKKDTFQFSMEQLPTGSYRALYKNVNSGYVDFIYDKENVTFSVHSKVGQPSVNYIESRENQLLDAYDYNMSVLQHKLDSIQFAYFKNPTSDVTTYQEVQAKITGAQQYYENLAKDDYCLAWIKASKKYNAPLPFSLPGDYIESATKHYFDYVNFDDKRLSNTDFLNKKIAEYVFQYHQYKDIGVQNKAFVNAIESVLSKITKPDVKENILRYLIQELVAKENREVLNKVMDSYKALPKNIQNYTFVKETEQFKKTMLGVVAPNIQLSKSETLHSLPPNNNKYLLIFWSSTCSHCLKELPKVKQLLANKTEIQVIAIGLEKKEDEQNWKVESNKFLEWKHSISLEKWNSKAANAYNISSTPSYFLLNSDKRIMAKPHNLKELELVLKH
ncbi:TlpA family protein disulfide reductase [Ochrovirga pacifica]|uniref:TlpA family protein disulfide reductase n=1 Tax=Ochrovirga pacifica TaxID=1042376 RepID=UPI0002559837|nr:thioredoxin-like domain-containing protein [Ochrovirga pacifica]